MLDSLEEGRDCYRRRAWGEACRALSLADESMPLSSDDLERLATAAYMSGRERVFQRIQDRLHHVRLDAGDPAGAARSAFWLGLSLLLQGETGPASAWLSRAQRHLQGRDCVEQGFLLVPLAEQQLAQGDAQLAFATASSAASVGDRFADADLLALARHLQGRGLIRTQQVAEGLALLDEAMLAVVEGALSPLVTGLIYCSVLEACQQIYAFSRAREWTAALQRWCEQQPQMVAFTGACRVHRAEVMKLNGAWPDAFAEVRRACEHYPRDSGRPPPATAFYLEGEIHRLRGDWTAAQASYQVASRMGCEPQPGLALLRLGQGRVEAACASIRRVLGATAGRLERARLLPAAVQIMLAEDDLQEARRASRELDEIAAGFAMPVIAAMAAQARGAVELAGGEARDALRSLRQAMEVWQQVDAPFEVARVRAMLGAACQLLGDLDGSALEFSAAREVFERLGAAPELERLDSLGRSPPGPNPHGLTPREMQVLRLVATGRTNKAIAHGLFLSERTIDRHVSNIFDKLGVASRAAATAYAYGHKLIPPDNPTSG